MEKMKLAAGIMSLPITSCVVVSRQRERDVVEFEVATHDMFGSPIDHLKSLHKEYDKFNDRHLKIYTVSGNGPALARLLGWTQEIKVMDASSKGLKEITIPAWVFPGYPEWVET